MKITKLRSFNKSENKFYYFLNGGYFDEKGQIAKPFRFDWENAEWYSGLRDKKDKEIYEGDILEFEENEWGGKDNIFVVEWDKEDACVIAGGGTNRECSEYKKVIGNKYENPELLTGC